MEKLLEFFPSLWSFVIFILYLVLCVGQGIFVTASHSKEGYNYNTVTVVFLTETLKLFLAFACYLKDHPLHSLWSEIGGNIKILSLYLVPSFLYCIYNNLAFINLSHFEPTNYFILLQLRVVITGITFQLVFNKKLTKIQWMSLGLLTCGCIIQQIDWDYFLNLYKNQGLSIYNILSVYSILIFIQTLCSCFAGVYNEHLLKQAGANVNVFIQNIFMYLDSILWNFTILIIQGETLSASFSEEAFRPIFQPLVMVIIVNNALVGIITSLFLKNLNSILKTFASAIEILLTAVLCWIFFGIDIKLNTIVAIAIVSYSLYVYSKNPVANRIKIVPEKTNEEKEAQLQNV